MRIKLETMELKLAQITDNTNATIDSASSTGADNCAAELSDGSWSVIGSMSSSDSPSQRQNNEGSQQRRKRRNRKQNKQNKPDKQNKQNKQNKQVKQNQDQSVAMQMSAMQNQNRKQETLISLLMSDPPMRKVG